MTTVDVIRARLETLRSEHQSDPYYHRGLENHLAEEWMEATGLARRQSCEVIAAWLMYGFASGRLTYEFADLIANDMKRIAQARAPVGTSDILDFLTPLSWEVYLAFDAGEFSSDPAFDPVEGNTRPLIVDLIRRSTTLVEYPPALAGLSAGPAPHPER